MIVQYKNKDEPENMPWQECDARYVIWEPNIIYRRKPNLEPPPPQPWTTDDVPLGAVYKFKDLPSVLRIPSSWNEEYMVFWLQTKCACYTYAFMAEHAEHTIDGKTWKPCHK